ncbi:MAG: insulinase family protein [Bacteroidales bacterium]|nr:insulinase family protein [Bacteroidales bacterium]
MRKHLFFLIVSFFCFVFSLSASAQQGLQVETFRLDNGLKVILCEEHSQPKVYGCVVVHAGSKDEKATATGVAHYFEHIMFKGTDRIGTTDWAKEKLYLDSISQAYDRLHATTDAKKRHDIQLEINRLNIAASKYAIPNEVDAILQKMGCTGLNAGTSYDYTVYYNTLPSNQLANWMDVYVERFRNPVFRLFQSELEAVYEEKNMYDNQTAHDFARNIFTEAFGEHPYSREVIGLAEHLKNPQPSEMQEFFNTYYVANNMTLLLVGDFNTAEASRLIKDKFSIWRSGELPQRPTYNMPKFESQKVLDVRQTPIKMGIMIFPGVTNKHPDHMPLDMLGSILGGGSGLLDKAASDNRIMMAQLMPLSLQEAGANVILYVPNIIGQKHPAAEQVIWDCIDSIKQGNFSDELLESIKTSSIVSRQRQLEDLKSISNLLLNLEMKGSDYQEWLRDNQRWMNLTRDEVIEVANKYFDRNHCTLVRSKMGFPKHDAAIKPDWQHLEAQNKDAHSPFARMIESNVPDPIKPQVVDFNKDVAITDVTPNCRLFSAPNPKNDVFNLRVYFNYGHLDDYNLDRALGYMELLGADGMNPQQYNMELDKLGGSASFYLSGDDQSCLSISGLEQNLDSILSLVSRWLFNPTHDQNQIDKLVDALRSSKRAAKNDADTWREALDEYIDFGERSSYLRQMPYQEWAKLTGEQLHDEVLKIFTHNGYATFTGHADPYDVCAKLRQYGLVRPDVEVVPKRTFKRNLPQHSQLYYAHNKKFLQSNIQFMINSTNFDTADQAACALFNEYLGGGMNGIIFQEIREFRSLGYRTQGRFNYNVFNLNPAYLYAYLGTQCDKTFEGIEAMRDLLVSFPERPDKVAPAIEQLVASRNSNHYTFRDLPDFVHDNMDRGWDHDCRTAITRQISRLTIDDLRAFHSKYIKGRPLVVEVVGNAKKFDPKALAKLLGSDTKPTEVKFEQMFKF